MGLQEKCMPLQKKPFSKRGFVYKIKIMKKQILKTIACSLLVLTAGCFGPKKPQVPDITETALPAPSQPPAASVRPTETPDEPEQIVYTSKDLDNLEHTEHFTRSSIEHIFLGTLKNNNRATGYHYDGIVDSPGQIDPGTKSETDIHGVYNAKVTVNGVAKKSNNGYSSFYPEDYSPQDVIDAINEAYENGVLISGSLYAGLTSDGIEIDYALDGKGRITTAYPIWEGR